MSLGLFFHRLSGHSYPHQPAPPMIADKMRAEAGFHLEDIDKALAELPDNFDISRADLDLLLSRAEIHAQARRVD
ncbi:hypothetical protein ACFSUK_23675 [Sphingobium scionense]